MPFKKWFEFNAGFWYLIISFTEIIRANGKIRIPMLRKYFFIMFGSEISLKVKIELS